MTPGFTFINFLFYNVGRTEIRMPSLDAEYIIVHLGMSTYRLDRTAFKGHTASEAANHAAHYKKLSWQERLRIAFYLNSIAFNYPENMPPRIDKTKFRARARNI